MYSSSRWLYLSPHFDDAVLSCGGLIYEQSRQGIQVEIWTIFAGDPPPGPLSEFALQQYALWGLATSEQVVAMRRDEDEAAAKIVRAHSVHFDFPDCIYRRSPQGEYLYTETVFTAPHPAERELSGQITNALRPKLHQNDVIVCPLALGGHVDHLLVRRAAESLGQPLWYYADVPYVFNAPQLLEEEKLALESALYPIAEDGLHTWLQGVAAYQSQLASLYRGEGTLLDAIRSYCTRDGGLRLWRSR